MPFSIVLAKANLIWSKCFSWWGIDVSINDKCVLDVIGGALLQSLPSRFHKIFQGVCMVVLWSIWRRRNKVVHATIEAKDEEVRVDVFLMIQANSLLWIANRSSKSLVSCKWKDWVLRPKEIFASSSYGLV